MKSELIDAFISGDLSGDSEAFVRHALENDASLRDRYLDQLRVHEALKIMMGDDAEFADFSECVLARLRSEGAATEIDPDRGFAKSVLTEILEERKVAKRHYWPDMIKAGLVAAAAAVVAVMALQHVSMEGSGKKKPRVTAKNKAVKSFVARVTGAENAVWNVESTEGIREDGWIKTREVILDQGVAEITFNSGAQVFLQGPAKLSLEHSNRGYLEYGRLTAEVPKRATGFVINTPRLNVVDIGTRFGVSVELNGDTELHVMQGVVEASRASGNSVPIRVEEGLALKADSRTRSELRPVTYAGDTFTLDVVESTLPTGKNGFVHYNFDESTGSILEDSGEGIEDGPFDTTLLPLSDENEPSRMSTMPRRAPGQHGGGLVFQQGEQLIAQLPNSISLDEAFTMSFWTKVSPRGPEGEEMTIATLGEPDSEKWFLSCNRDITRGAGNAVRIDYGNGHIIGTTDIRDGQWHHITMRFLGGDKADLATHLHLFVDGKLESISDVFPTKIEPGLAGQIQFGGIEENGFEGWIDEFYLHKGSLSEPIYEQSQISEPYADFER